MKKNSIVLTVVVYLFHIQAFSYGTFLNSAKVLKNQEYDLSAFTQFFSESRRGAFISGVVDLPLSYDKNLRFYAGVGSYDYALGAQLKWVPYQQVDDYIFSIGTTFGLDYGNDDRTGFLLARVSPFISRDFSWEFGHFEPYIALPIGSLFINSDSNLYAQTALGAHFYFEELKYMRFTFEGGFNIKNAQSYLAIMATLQLTQK